MDRGRCERTGALFVPFAIFRAYRVPIVRAAVPALRGKVDTERGSGGYGGTLQQIRGRNGFDWRLAGNNAADGREQIRCFLASVVVCGTG